MTYFRKLLKYERTVYFRFSSDACVQSQTLLILHVNIRFEEEKLSFTKPVLNAFQTGGKTYGLIK